MAENALERGRQRPTQKQKVRHILRSREVPRGARSAPQLVWAGKAERTSFEVEAPSIHVHERVSAEDVIRSVEREPPELALFDYGELDRSKAVETA